MNCRTISLRPMVVSLSSLGSESVLVKVTICTMKCKKLRSSTSMASQKLPSSLAK